MQKTLEKFNQWNEKKKEVEFGVVRKKDIQIGELWRCREGMNIGNEISKDGKHRRIYLILQTHLGNDLVLAAPLTTHIRKHLHGNYTLEVQNPVGYKLKPCDIVVNQIRLIDKKRCEKKNSNKKLPLGLVNKVLYMYRSIIKK